MKRLAWTSSFGLLLCSTFTACRTVSTSSEKSLPIPTDGILTYEAWVPACQAELANPVSGAASRQDLIQIAKTDDCAAAFPAIRKIVDDYLAKR